MIIICQHKVKCYHTKVKWYYTISVSSLILLIGTLREKRILTMLAIKAMLIGVYLANSISGWKSQIGSSSWGTMQSLGSSTSFICGSK